MRTSPIQNDFSGGEFSPVVQARSDHPRYKTGLAKCLNAIPTLQGPAIRRSGTRYIANARFDGTTILIPFKYSNIQAYMLEFGVGYINVYKDRGLLNSFYIPTSFTAPDLKKIRYTQSLDTLILVCPGFAPLQLTRTSDVQWTLSAISFTSTPYLDSELDPTVCIVTNPKYVPAVLTNLVPPLTVESRFFGLTLNPATITNNGSGKCRITFTDPNIFKSGSFVNISGVTGTTNANGDQQLIQINPTTYDLPFATFNAAYINGGSVVPSIFLNANDVGRFFRFKTGSANPWSYGSVATWTDSAHFTLFGTNLSSGTAALFNVGAWGVNPGYPTNVQFHQQRLWFSGPQAQTLYGSVIGDYYNFEPSNPYNADGSLNILGTITDRDACSFVISSNDSNPITWMTSDEYGMPVGTEGGSFVMKASSVNEAITPTNISIKKVDSAGCLNLNAVVLGKSTVFLSNTTRKVYELTYYYNIDGYRKTDLTEIASNISLDGFTSNIAIQNLPQPILWVARNDGTLLSMTFDRSLDVLRVGWASHVLGGVSDGSGTPATAEWFAVIPSPDGLTEDVWMVVSRLVNGTHFRSIEVMEKVFEDFDKPEDYFGVDCGVTFDRPLVINFISNANPAVVGVTAHGLTTGAKVLFRGTHGLETEAEVNQINGKTFTVTVIDADHFSLDGFDSTYLSLYTGGGSVRKLVSTVTGVTWLAGEKVSILGDGVYLGDVTVSLTGVVTLPVPAATVQIGLPYSMEIQGLRIEAGSQDGTSMGKYRRINQLGVNINRSGDFEAGVSFSNMVPISVSENADDQYQEADPLFTGILNRLGVESNYDYQNQWAFRVKTPTPFQLLAVYPQMGTNDFG